MAVEVMDELEEDTRRRKVSDFPAGNRKLWD